LLPSVESIRGFVHAAGFAAPRRCLRFLVTIVICWKMFLWCRLKGQFKTTAEEELTRLQEFARSEGFTERLQMWDLPYWRRRQKQHMFK